MIFISNSEDETKNFAEKIAKNISVGKVIALNGDLGTGKTTFTQGFATAMGISESVSSPTFKLISQYLGGKYWLYHIDAYRLNNANEFLNIGGEDYLYPTNGITLIEWADIISDLLDNNIINIRFYRVEGKQKKRKLEIEGIEFNL